MRWEIRNPRTPIPPLLPHYRMTVMSLLVLVLSWGSMGLEAATAVVSTRGWGWGGDRHLGSKTPGAEGP